MSLTRRKLVVLAIIGTIFLLANALIVAAWLQDNGIIEWACSVRSEFITGTAITVILALLILLVRPGNVYGSHSAADRRCPVCDHLLTGRGRYCSECGSRA